MEQIKLKLPDLDYVSLDYEPILDIKNDNPRYENEIKTWRLAGFTEENTKYERCYPAITEFVQFGATLFDRCTVSVKKQLPGQTLPRHVDSFTRESFDFGVDPKNCVRVHIFLENWKSGHYFEINDKPIVPWERGDAVMIEKHEPHLSGNNGMEPKFTMQVTGPKSEFKGF
jgi:hypothetical protein